MTIEEMIKVMQAYSEGKTIQCKEVNDNDYDAWYVCNPAWDWANYDYRVKPESTYRPYKNLEEFKKDIVRKYGSEFEHIFEHRNIWLKSKYTEYIGQIISLTTDNVFVDGNYNSWKTVFNNYTYLDGTSFGIKE